MDAIRHVLGYPLTVAGIATLLLGPMPLLMVVLFGPADANPIGLGLLFFFSVPVGVTMVGVGIFEGLRRARRERGTPRPQSTRPEADATLPSKGP